MWHCPHCGAPQAETARCWVCRRSSTTCSTCSHFRRALSADLGYCALDRRRLPLTGRELRGCWEARLAAEPGAPSAGSASRPSPTTSLENDDPASPAHRLRRPGVQSRLGTSASIGDGTSRGFVPVELIGRVEVRPVPAVGPPPEPEPEVPTPLVIADVDDDWSARTSLFGDPTA